MPNTQHILFIHRKESIPELIMQEFKSRVPAGFSLALSERDDPADDRRSKVAVADYIVAYGVSFNDLDVAKSVKLLQLLSAGFDRLDLDAFRAAGIPVANNGGANAPTVAEHAMLLILSIYKKLPLHHNAMHEGRWIGHGEALNMRELRGKQVGIIGFGKIGQEVARMASGFKTKIAYHDVQKAPAETEKGLDATYMPLDELCRTSDIITIHTPLNDATRGIMSAEMFALMKPTAIFINTARGKVMDEPALIAALDAGTIMGAGLDCFWNEPLEPGSKFLGRDNVVVTPHNAGTSLDTWWRRLDFAFANVARVSRGETPLATIDG
jgi:phosphoglycerate dehydrogenase-like enzyme